MRKTRSTVYGLLLALGVLATAHALPTVSVTAPISSATIGTANYAQLVFTRAGDANTSALTVNYTLGGSAVKWMDYRRYEGDMPVSVTIPAGAASTTMTIVAVTNCTGANPLNATFTLAPDAAYTIGSPNSASLSFITASGSGSGSITNTSSGDTSGQSAATNTYTPSALSGDITLNEPKIGDNSLRILSPTMIELTYVNTKALTDANPASWNFIDSAFNAFLPAASQFAVTVNGQTVNVQTVGFKRRPIYAPLNYYDLRIANYVYLQLATPIADNQTVQVANPSGNLWVSSMQFTATANPLRYGPAIHVNQEGYVPNFPKKANVGFYLGSLGELDLTGVSTFQIVDAKTGVAAYSGTLTSHPDAGYNYTPTPYQKVVEADFTGFNTPGQYQLVVPGLGASLPFLINDGIAMNFARTYELGLYHQRCGTSNSMPFTRFTHDACHTLPTTIPVPQSSYQFTWNTISTYANQASSDNPPQVAPKLTSESAQLYPYVKTGTIDTTGGHHDAGDYSKYTINSASLVHFLMFAVDSLNGVASLDNLGIPESGDGISDVMQEAKWESDYLAKLQDSDGGFYFLTYPMNREYENNVTPDHGDAQVVWPKTTSVTAAAVAALAECASSPRFKAQYPAAAALYMQKAQLGWQFLMNAIAKYGKDGAYQKITHYGDDFTHNDELAWAACEMFLATGDQSYQNTLKQWFPDPTDPATFRWGWWRQYASYGNCVRSYAFAVQSGRLQASQLDSAYLAKCVTTVTNCANDVLQWAQQCSYGSSFPFETKAVKSAGWYFSSDQAFDIAVAYQLSPRADYLDAMVRNMNYEAGCNPVNQSYITGLGWKRQHEIVDQYSQNDRRVMPKTGVPLGSIQMGFVWISTYQSTLTALTYPNDNGSNPYPWYDRWSDTFNVTTEFVHLTTARSLATTAFLATLTPLKSQSWSSANAQITGLPAQVETNTAITASLSVPGIDLSNAKIVWEAEGQTPVYGTNFMFSPTNYGTLWVEAEVELPDGRRIFAVTNFFAQNTLPDVTITSSAPLAVVGGTQNASFTLTRTGATTNDLPVTLIPTGTATKWVNYRRTSGDMPDTITIPTGSSSVTTPIVAYSVVGSLSATLTIAGGSGYNVSSPNSVTLMLMDAATALTASNTVPTVLLTSPGNNTTVSGSAVITASAVDVTGVSGVQFQVDGANTGSEVTSGPYSTTLDTTTLANGTHALTAVARNVMGNTATAIAVNVTVTNTVSGSNNGVGGGTGIITNSIPSAIAKAPDNSIKLNWTSTAGKIYRVAVKTNLSDSKWTDLSTNITATGTASSWSEPVSTSVKQRFFLVYPVN